MPGRSGRTIHRQGQMGRSARSSILQREMRGKREKESRLFVKPKGGIRKMIELELSDQEFEQVKTVKQ